MPTNTSMHFLRTNDFLTAEYADIFYYGILGITEYPEIDVRVFRYSAYSVVLFAFDSLRSFAYFAVKFNTTKSRATERHQLCE
jgi:hypothetical protein